MPSHDPFCFAYDLFGIHRYVLNWCTKPSSTAILLMWLISLFFDIIAILIRTASSYERGPSHPAQLGPRALQSPPNLAPKDAGLGAKVKTQASVWAVVFAVMGRALEVQKAECMCQISCRSKRVCLTPNGLGPLTTGESRESVVCCCSWVHAHFTGEFIVSS